MLGPAADLSQLGMHLSEVHLDVLQPARRSVRPAEVAPALLALLQEVISHDEPPVMVPRQPSLPTRRTYLGSCRAPLQAKDALRCSPPACAPHSKPRVAEAHRPTAWRRESRNGCPVWLRCPDVP